MTDPQPPSQRLRELIAKWDRRTDRGFDPEEDDEARAFWRGITHVVAELKTASTEAACINCGHVFRADDIRGSCGPPHASVGLFCEECYATIKAHEEPLEVRRARAVDPALVAALREKWQPIESAPKDGTPLLLFSPLDYFTFGNVENGLIWVSGGWRCGSSGWRGDGGIDHEPTHWMPLPPPPPDALARQEEP
jgi:hypothetical protein